MKRDNINYLAVGSVVLIAFVLLLYMLYRLTGGVDENDVYTVYYPNVGGLGEGTPVTYEGYKIGSVTGIWPERTPQHTRYRVVLHIRDGWQIPQDSVARIFSEGLLAETVINIDEGASNEFLKPGDELQGMLGTDVFAAVNDVASSVNQMLQSDVRPLIENLNSRISHLGEQVDQRLPKILDGLQALVDTLQHAAGSLPRMLNPSTEAKITRIVSNSEEISNNLLRLSDGLLETRQATDTLLDQSNNTVAENREDIRRAITALRLSLESLSTNTETILRNLEGASHNVNEFSRQIRQNPAVLLNAKPPREEGIGNE
ncbi:MAG: MCE family protein [Candidatus Thiodiazotropha sp. (ex Monitilora ramsayi)]|nr:MCE family protein [Candidatus Thiodiazotropha sp. (ex Monitilora ramsayi)]